MFVANAEAYMNILPVLGTILYANTAIDGALIDHVFESTHGHVYINIVLYVASSL